MVTQLIGTLPPALSSDMQDLYKQLQQLENKVQQAKSTIRAAEFQIQRLQYRMLHLDNRFYWLRRDVLLLAGRIMFFGLETDPMVGVYYRRMVREMPWRRPHPSAS